MKLKNWMVKAKVQAGMMAKFLSVDPSYIHSIIKGRRKPSGKILEKINDLTMDQVLTFDDLIGNEED